MKKILTILGLIIGLIFAVLGIYNLATGGTVSEDIIGYTGWGITFCLIFEMILFFAQLGFNYTKKNELLRNFFIGATSFLKTGHSGIGFILLGTLILHFGLTFNVTEALTFTYITGYLPAILVFISMLFAIPSKKFAKPFKTIHIVTAFLAIIPFFMHIFD